LIEERRRLGPAGHPGETGGTLRRPQRPPEVDVDDVVAAQMPEEAAERGCLAGDGGTGEPAGREVGEVPAQRDPVEVPGRGAPAALRPGDELADVPVVGGAGVGAGAGEGGDEPVDVPCARGVAVSARGRNVTPDMGVTCGNRRALASLRGW
jgi:hypothetical protein